MFVITVDFNDRYGVLLCCEELKMKMPIKMEISYSYEELQTRWASGIPEEDILEIEMDQIKFWSMLAEREETIPLIQVQMDQLREQKYSLQWEYSPWSEYFND